MSVSLMERLRRQSAIVGQLSAGPSRTRYWRAITDCEARGRACALLLLLNGVSHLEDFAQPNRKRSPARCQKLQQAARDRK